MPGPATTRKAYMGEEEYKTSNESFAETSGDPRNTRNPKERCILFLIILCPTESAPARRSWIQASHRSKRKKKKMPRSCKEKKGLVFATSTWSGRLRSGRSDEGVFTVTKNKVGKKYIHLNTHKKPWWLGCFGVTWCRKLGDITEKCNPG